MATRKQDDQPSNEAAAPARAPAKSRRAAIVPLPQPAEIAVPDIHRLALPATGLPSDLNDQRTWVELRRLQLETERAALELAALRRSEQDWHADHRAAHVYTFYAPVDSESVQQCLAELGRWTRRDPGCPITVIFNSPGGSVLDGLALFDYLRQLSSFGHTVTTVALGRAASMGAVLLQAGDRRVIGQNTFLLVHEVSNLSAGKISEMEDSVEFSKRLQKRLLAILSERSKLTAQEIARRWARKEWWLDAEDALAMGFADALF